MLTPLVAPGRRLIKRGTLIRSGGEGEGAGRKAFEFLLLSDYLLWIEHEEPGIGVLVHDGGGQSPRRRRPSIDALGSNDEEKWWCRGHMSLVDMEVVMVAGRPSGVGPGGAGEERVEVLSPEGSFALYHGKPFDCLWCSLVVMRSSIQVQSNPTRRIRTVSILGWTLSELHGLRV